MKNWLAAIAIAAMGFFATPDGASAAPVVDASALASVAQQGGGDLEQVHYRRYFHCHRYRWRRYCHGRRPYWRPHRRYRRY
jgi:hypothetical protein